MVVGPNKRRNKNKWGLPQVLVPDGTTPLCVNVPNDPQWIAKFYGAIYNLSIERNWDWNENEDRIGVAARWFEVYQDLLNGGCETMNCAELLACLYGSDTLRRFNEETGRVETSSDGGSTWEVDETHDPRFVAARNDIVVTACDTPNFMVGAIQYFIDRQQADIEAGAGVVGVTATASAFLGLLFGISPYVVVGAALAQAITAFTSAAIEAALTVDVWDRLLCNLRCNITQNPITISEFDAVLSQLGDDETGIAYTVLWHTINSMGPAGLQNVVALGLDAGYVTVDCDDCNCEGAWCYNFLFSAGQQDWAPALAGGVTPAASWGGTYWAPVTITGERNLRIRRSIPTEGVITNVVIGGTIWTAAPTQFFFGNETTNEIVNVSPIPSGAYTYDSGPVAIEYSAGDIFRVDKFRAVNTAEDWAILYVQLSGIGGNPFGADNC